MTVKLKIDKKNYLMDSELANPKFDAENEANFVLNFFF